MKRILLFFFPLFFCSVGFSQTFMELNDQFIEFYQKQNYAAAVIVGEKAVVKAKEEFGTKNINYAISLYNLGEGYFNLKSWDKALQNYKSATLSYKAIDITIEVQGQLASINNSIGTIFFINDKPDSAIIYFNQSADYFLHYTKDNTAILFVVAQNLADSYYKLNNYKGLLEIAEKILPVLFKEKGKNSADYYSMIYNKGHALYYLERFAEAEKTLIEALQLVDKLQGKNNDEYTAVLIQLFKAVKMQNRFHDAELYLVEALKIYEKLLQIDSALLATTYKEAADFYSDNSFFEIAENYYSKSLKVLKATGDVNSDLYYSILQSKSYAYIQAGRLLEAKKILNDLLAVYQSPAYGDNATAAELLIVVGNAEAQLGELDAAESHALQGMAMIKKVFNDDSYLRYSAHEILGMVYYKRGENNKSLTAYSVAIEIAEKYFGKDSRQEASLLSNQGNTYQVMGNYAAAEVVLKKSQEIRKTILGEQHPDYALSLINLGMVLVMQSRYDEADKLLADAINIYVKKKLEGTTNFISLVMNVALMEQQRGDNDAAKTLYFRLQQIIQTREDKNIEPLVLLYTNMSSLYLNEKKYDSALIYASESAKLMENNNKINTTEFIKTVNILMVALKEKGDFGQANKIAVKLLSLCKKVMGDEAELLGVIYTNIAMLELAQRHVDKAGEYIQAGNAILLKHFKQNFYVLSEKEKLTWWDDKSFRFNLFPSLLLQYIITSGPQVAAMVDQQLQLKGFVLQDAAANLRKARSSASPALLQLLNNWHSNKTILNKLYALPVNERIFSTDSLEKLTNALEKQVNQIAAADIGKPLFTIDWKLVQASLQQDEAAIEFVRIPYYRNGVYSDTIQYAAIIISKSLAAPQFILLASEKKLVQYLSIDSAGEKEVSIHKLYRGLKINQGSSFIGDSIYAAVWQPLMPFLQNIKKVSFSPDGILHKLAFHAMPVTKDSILIDLFQLQQYSSIRQIAERVSNKNASWQSVYLLGNPDFNTTISENNNINRNSKPGPWQPLPGTGKEVNSLLLMFKLNNIAATSVSETKATEASFKLLSNHSPEIIHLATHGFFLQQKQVEKHNTSNISDGGQTLASADDPLLRSGFVVAGANKAWGKTRLNGDTEDGIVTAYEIAQLNLSNTQLVVLSACETALGDVQGTEGVFGLQRAFKIAGVKNLVVSLWQVPDKETAELMKLFYTNLLNKEAVRDAFNHAQKTMRSKYPPYFWAAFVLIE
ncbi:MAG: CHAT domain-containing tetratricopeptide repeat protein [Chitinophagaceae bacterium]